LLKNDESHFATIEAQVQKWKHTQGCYFMSLQAWTWTSKHKQGSRIKSFFNILPMWTRYLNNILSHLGQNIWWHGRIFFHVSRMNDIYGLKWGWKMTMDELFHEHL
jgi:hypothetical protein